MLKVQCCRAGAEWRWGKFGAGAVGAGAGWSQGRWVLGPVGAMSELGPSEMGPVGVGAGWKWDRSELGPVGARVGRSRGRSELGPRFDPGPIGAGTVWSRGWTVLGPFLAGLFYGAEAGIWRQLCIQPKGKTARNTLNIAKLKKKSNIFPFRPEQNCHYLGPLKKHLKIWIQKC